MLLLWQQLIHFIYPLEEKKDFLHYALRFEGIVTNYVDISIAGICLIKPNLRCQREKLLRIDRTC